MVKNYAVIDIGTLKVKLLIASPRKSGPLKQVHFSNTLTCFGVDIEKNNGKIGTKYLNQTITELNRCKELLNQFNVVQTRVVSTHALRKAKNKSEVTRRIKNATGFEVENISQEAEAKLFFDAVIRDFVDDRDYAIVDVGGGSVQVLIGNKNGLKTTHLMHTGAQYLHDNFTRDPSLETSVTTKKDLGKMRKLILSEITELKRGIKTPLIYGSSNIIDLMKAINIPLKTEHSSATHPYKTYPKHLKQFVASILPLSYGQREKKYPFQWGYMWGIDKGFLNIITLSEYLQSPFILPSNANIAQGIIYSMIN
jgi:exopolyphosphatase/pppGpp-phosphohydrolase